MTATAKSGADERLADGRPAGALWRVVGAPWRGAALLALFGLSAALEAVGLLLLAPLLRAVDAGRAVLGGPLQLSLGLGELLAVFVAVVFLRAFVAHVRKLMALRFNIETVDRLRQRCLSALVYCEWRTLVGMDQARNASILLEDADRVGWGLGNLLVAIAAALTLIGVGAAGLAISPVVTLLAAAAGVIVLLAYHRLRRRATDLGSQLGRAQGAVYAHVNQALSSLRVIKSFGREDFAIADGERRLTALREAQTTFERISGRAQIGLQAGGAAVLAIVVWVSVARWNLGSATILPMIAVFLRALPLLGSVQSGWQNWAHAVPALRATLQLIDSAEAAREPAIAGADPPELAQAIVLTGVEVRFPGRLRPALDIAELVFPARSVTALTGPSGAGKSTLADLLAGLLAPDSGQLTLDGRTLSAAERIAWRRQVAYVQQEPVLFHGSVRDNLLWAEPGASAEQLEAALRDASAEFVLALPQGLDTPVGDLGRQLSGGERQRIVLARALLRDPALLILDEPTSALDPDNEAAIAEAVARMRDRLTIVIIGHRGLLTRQAERQIRLDAGRVIAPGAEAAA